VVDRAQTSNFWSAASSFARRPEIGRQKSDHTRFASRASLTRISTTRLAGALVLDGAAVRIAAMPPSLLGSRPGVPRLATLRTVRTITPRCRHLLSRHTVPRRRHCPPVAAAAAAPAAAAAGAQALGSALQTAWRYAGSSIDPWVLGSTASATFKLFLICAAVGWLLRAGRIPNATAAVLSQVSFQLLIPCMLFSKVAATLAAQPDATLVLGMAAAAVAQVCLGAAWGLLLSPLVDGAYPRSTRLFGWHPLDPERSAAAIAAATAAASGVPQAAAALLPRARPAPQGLRQLVAAGCAFGNSFTLPAVFFLSLLPPVLADRAIAYCGLFLLAWSPCMWSAGLALVEGGFGPAAPPPEPPKPAPLAWQAAAAAAAAQKSSVEQADAAPPAPSPQEAVFDIESEQSSLLPAPAPWARRLRSHPAVARLARFAGRALNPPVLSILAGAVVGMSPLSKQLFLQAAGGGAPPVALPIELGLLRAALRCALEVVELLAGGTLAMQTLVLASSLLQRPEGPGAPLAAAPGGGGGGRGGGRGWLAAVRAALAPADAAEARALAVLSAVRFVLLPVSAVLAFRWAAAAGLLGPTLGADPIFLFVVAVQAVMPSAQNLILMLQLSDVTRPAAPGFARMLLKLYAYSVLPVTLWVTAFASRLAIPLA
jgi:predicted permease